MSSKKTNLFLLIECSSLKIWYLLKKESIRSCNVHKINKSRLTLGEFHHLYEQLREHTEKFHAYFRISISTLDYILEKIQYKLFKNWTNLIKNPIGPTERLAVTLRSHRRNWICKTQLTWDLYNRR